MWVTARARVPTGQQTGSTRLPMPKHMAPSLDWNGCCYYRFPSSHTDIGVSLLSTPGRPRITPWTRGAAESRAVGQLCGTSKDTCGKPGAAQVWGTSPASPTPAAWLSTVGQKRSRHQGRSPCRVPYTFWGQRQLLGLIRNVTARALMAEPRRPSTAQGPGFHRQQHKEEKPTLRAADSTPLVLQGAAAGPESTAPGYGATKVPPVPGTRTAQRQAPPSPRGRGLLRQP